LGHLSGITSFEDTELITLEMIGISANNNMPIFDRKEGLEVIAIQLFLGGITSTKTQSNE
jgi:hypothetical protein